MQLDPIAFSDLVERSHGVFVNSGRDELTSSYAWRIFVEDMLNGKLSAADAGALLDDPLKVAARFSEAAARFDNSSVPTDSLLHLILDSVERNGGQLLAKLNQHSGDLATLHSVSQQLQAVATNLVTRVGNVERSTSLRAAVAIAISTGIASSLLASWVYPHLAGTPPTIPEVTVPGRSRENARGEAAGDPPSPVTVRLDQSVRLQFRAPDLLLPMPAAPIASGSAFDRQRERLVVRHHQINHRQPHR